MMEAWEAARLLAQPKLYVGPRRVDLRPGSVQDYPLESDDGLENFFFDVHVSRRNRRKVSFQLRHTDENTRLARLCTAVPHTNPDGERVQYPHLHQFDEETMDGWAVLREDVVDIGSALQVFCKTINLPLPVVEEGLR